MFLVGRSQFVDGFPFSPSIPILTDISILPVELDSSLFPGINSDVKVHEGFSSAHKRYALR
jgi:hypothetical protein